MSLFGFPKRWHGPNIWGRTREASGRHWRPTVSAPPVPRHWGYTCFFFAFFFKVFSLHFFTVGIFFNRPTCPSLLASFFSFFSTKKNSWCHFFSLPFMDVCYTGATIVSFFVLIFVKKKRWHWTYNFYTFVDFSFVLFYAIAICSSATCPPTLRLHLFFLDALSRTAPGDCVSDSFSF